MITGPTPAKPTPLYWGFGLQLPSPFRLCADIGFHLARLSGDPLETYYSCSQPITYSVVIEKVAYNPALVNIGLAGYRLLFR